ncbi:MAG: hypothetical protein LBR61_00080 [Synergistaceae bacterium]|jgi:hypothetical protein|nr:hypothetical protein [Synergistaceae bacterium]
MKKSRSLAVAVTVFLFMASVLFFSVDAEAATTRSRKKSSTSSNTTGVVRIYDGQNYEGNGQLLPVGKYLANNIRIGNDRLSSVRIASGYKVTLFTDNNFNGRQLVLTKDTPRLGPDFENKVSSIIVERLQGQQTRKTQQNRARPDNKNREKEPDKDRNKDQNNRQPAGPDREKKLR